MNFTTISLVMMICIEVYCSKKQEFRPVPYRGITPMVWVDGRNREDGEPVDTFYDRAVVVLLARPRSTRPQSRFSFETTGVLITDITVLTSYNPFAELSRNAANRNLLLVKYLYCRLFHVGGKLKSYYIRERGVLCARPVVPLREKLQMDPNLHIKHGINYPIHDLMVLRLNESCLLHLPDGQRPQVVYEFLNTDAGGNDTWDEKNKAYFVKFGAVLTDVAVATDELKYPLRFASMGHIDDRHIEESRYLERQVFHEQDDVIADCEKVFPREWGRFICIRNIHNYAGLAAGALLFTGDKLVGMGAFAMWKGRNGYFVFTDLRAYRHLLFNTCTPEDQYLVRRRNDYEDL